MTTYYLDSSGGSNTAPYDTWAKAATTLATLIAIPLTNADTIYVGPSHSESTGAGGLAASFPSTLGLRMLGVADNTTSPPTTLVSSPTATFATSAGNTVAITGCAYIYGCIFQAGTSTSSAVLSVASGTAASQIVSENCRYATGCSGSTARIQIGATGSTINKGYETRFRDCVFHLSATTQRIQLASGRHRFRSCSMDASSAVGTVFSLATDGVSDAVFDACDFSGITGSPNILDQSGTTTARLRFIDCKFSGTTTYTTGTVPAPGHSLVEITSPDSMYLEEFAGIVRSETSITKSGTAVTINGTDTSWKLSSGSGAQYPQAPLMSLEMLVHITAADVGVSKTLTIEFEHDSATGLTNAQIWPEVIYPKESSDDLGGIATSRPDVLTTPTTWGSSTATWNNTGGQTNPNKQKMTVSFTPQREGEGVARVYLGAASKTVYVEPDPALS